MSKTFYVTTPIYYVNDAPHIGHAYTTIAADVLARWHRQRGESVWFLTGTDEHGQKVLRSAQAGGSSPQEWADRLVAEAWQPTWRDLDISNDDFIRTTEERHTRRVQTFLQRLYDKGEIYEGVYEGPYCVACEEFKLPGELIEGEGRDAGQRLCPVHRRPVEQVSETNYFFRLSKYADQLLEHYAAHPEAVEPESARNEVVQFIRQGLQDLSISRSSFDWGVKVPWDDRQVVYVWFDALLNYITAVGYDASEPELREKFESTWPADVHLIGKDILRFHAVIWPAMLMAAGLPLPRKVFAHGWLLVSGEKMSKTRLTGIAPAQLTGYFGSDAFRYYILRAFPFGQDGSFSWEEMTARYTAELANGLGNLASRLTAMTERYRGGVIPSPGEPTEAEQRLGELAARVTTNADAAMEKLDFYGALAAIWELVVALNGYLTEQQPWQVAKRDDAASQQRLDAILYAAAEGLRVLAILLHPFMPRTCTTLWASVGGPEALGPLAAQPLAEAARWGRLPVGARVVKGEPLFPRLPDESPATGA
ncbi:MAG: methionine--tRNA ligase [Acidothermus sp.]|nr:methionine--tRNA ligase [Acidothermus sp.]MCL6538432.1 methionine--tRNA ligase [Acidothermus sp.]